jgi:L-alanine-DL-glutamate epimerase-like enolase superfamily enzyme
VTLTHYRQTLRPRHRFATSQGGIDEKETIVVRLEHAGTTGWGEAVPSALYGQTLEASEAALDAMRPLLGDDPLEIEPILQRVLAAHDAQRAAVCALDSALHDWAGRRLGVPVWRLLGLARPRVRTTFTIGVAELGEIREKLEEALAAGFAALKVKVGVGPEHDEQVLALIRAAFGGPLYLDANQAWSPGEAETRLRALARFRPVLVEQPLRKADWREMARLCALHVAPLFADESCERPADVLRLHGCVDGVNIKLSKCGGIRQALRMIALARALGMQVMLGCFVSSSLAIAPALAIARLADHADLDGHLLLAADPFAGVRRDGAMLELPDEAGLGVRHRSAPRPSGSGS